MTSISNSMIHPIITPETYPTIYLKTTPPKPADPKVIAPETDSEIAAIAAHFIREIGHVQTSEEFQILINKYPEHDINVFSFDFTKLRSYKNLALITEDDLPTFTVVNKAIIKCPIEVIRAMLDRYPLLINKGACPSDFYINTAISRAIKEPQILKLFIERGANINLVSNCHHTPLNCAAHRATLEETLNDAEIFPTKYLLLRGAISYRTRDQMRAPDFSKIIHMAVKKIKDEYATKDHYLSKLNRSSKNSFRSIGPDSSMLIMNYLTGHANFLSRLTKGIHNNWKNGDEPIHLLDKAALLLKEEESLIIQINHAIERGENTTKLLEQQSKHATKVEALNELSEKAVLDYYAASYNIIELTGDSKEASEIKDHFLIEKDLKLSSLELVRKLQAALEITTQQVAQKKQELEAQQEKCRQYIAAKKEEMVVLNNGQPLTEEQLDSLYLNEEL